MVQSQDGSSPVAGLSVVRVLTLPSARHAAAHALAGAAEEGVAISVAVVDRAAHLLSFDRMDGAAILTGQLAQDKAYTVAAFGLATHEWWDMIKDEPPLVHGVVKTHRLIVFGGGVPIRYDDEIVGAVGVSGSTAEQDQELAEAAAASCEAMLRSVGTPVEVRK